MQRRRFRTRQREDDWEPKTNLGKLVKAGKIEKIDEIYEMSIPVKEHQIVEKLIGPENIHEEVIKVWRVQKQTSAGQRTKCKALVLTGNMNGYVGIGVKAAAQAADAIRGAMLVAKKSIIPVRLGYWGNKIGMPHTVPMAVKGKSGSVSVKLYPAPRGTGIVAAPVSKLLLSYAGISDVFTQSNGKTRTLENFLKATFQAVQKTYEYLTPDLWAQTKIKMSPLEKHSKFLGEIETEAVGDNALKKIAVSK